jgi:hypothetical protein
MAILGIPRLAAETAGAAMGTGTGQYGIVPTIVPAGSGDLIAKIAALPTKPFAGSLSAIDIFLVVGVVGFASIVWGFMLYHVRLAAKQV